MTEIHDNSNDIYEALMDRDPNTVKIIEKAMNTLRVLKSNLISKNEV